MLLLAGIRLARTEEVDFVESTVGNTAIVLLVGIAILMIAGMLLALAARAARTDRLRSEGLVAVAAESSGEEA